MLYFLHEKPESLKAAYPPLYGGAYPPDEKRRGLPMYVTYTDLFQLLIFIATLVGLVYEIVKDKQK